ncbi:MAG: transposase, partial [Chlamydiia bacterium]
NHILTLRFPCEWSTSNLGDLIGKLFGDRGYISKDLTEGLLARGLHLITRLRSNMKNKLMEVCDRLLLRTRRLIESVFNCLKNKAHLEHHRHRSVPNFLVNLFGSLAAYSLHGNKPSLRLEPYEESRLEAVA